MLPVRHRVVRSSPRCTAAASAAASRLRPGPIAGARRRRSNARGRVSEEPREVRGAHEVAAVVQVVKVGHGDGEDGPAERPQQPLAEGRAEVRLQGAGGCRGAV